MEQHWNLSSHASPTSAINPALEGSTGCRAATLCRILLWLWVPRHPGPGERPSYLVCNFSSPQYHSSLVCKACGRKGERTRTDISEAAVACGNHRTIQAGRDLRRSLVQPLLRAWSATTYDEVAQSFRMCNARSASPFCMLSRKQFTLSFLTRGNKAEMRSFLSPALFREMQTLGGCPASHSLKSKTLACAPRDPLRQSPPPALQTILSGPCVDYGLHIPAFRRVSRCRSGMATAQFNKLIWNNQPTRRRQPGAHGRN